MEILINNGAFTGRNGTFKMKGLVITESSDSRIVIRPLLNNGNTANAMICFSMNDINLLINTLNQIKHENS